MNIDTQYIGNNLEILNSWYAVYTMPRSEKKVEERFNILGIDTYLPIVSSIRMWSDRKKKVKSPLIPGYVFIKTHEEKLTELYKIQGALGVVRHVGKPAKVSWQELENIRILLNDPDSFQGIENIDLRTGEQFDITFGPFSGLSGTFIRHNGKFRAIIALDSIRKQFEVNVPISFLQKIL